MDFKPFDAVILANGDFPKAKEPLEQLRQARFLCCCDAAAMAVEHCDVVIGDGDSLSGLLKQKFKDSYIQISEQEDNDQTKATRYCISRGFRNILYLGSTGKREDHTLGNISLMVEYMRSYGIRPTMMTDYGVFTPHHGNHTFDSFPRQQVSIFDFGCSHLECDGLLYPLHPFTNWWQGTLNESLSTQFSIFSDGDYLVFRTFLPKQ